MRYASLSEFIDSHRQLFVLTGAGCSTESGIPDYRDAAGRWKHTQPIMLQAFMADAAVRRRYWARSLIGWQRVHRALPNDAHFALAQLESEGRIRLLLTQNVDGLHQAAGSVGVTELHGNIAVVRCMSCGMRLPREQLQGELANRNPEFIDLDATLRPDGDAELADADFTRFYIPDCARCGGVLKPDVVFFGECVPRERVGSAMDELARADAMLVVGSSLMVHSGYRFVRAMADAGKPIAAVNLGLTRADELLNLKVSAPCSKALSFVLPAASRAADDDGH